MATVAAPHAPPLTSEMTCFLNSESFFGAADILSF